MEKSASLENSNTVYNDEDNAGNDTTDESLSSSMTSSDSLKSENTRSICFKEDELNRQLSKPDIFCWHPPTWKDLPDPVEFTPSLENIDEYLHRKIITNEPTLPSETWLLGGSFGSRNAILVFRSSALANSSELSIQSKPGYKLHITYKVLQAETKLLSKILDCHGITEVATNSSDFNILWTGSHPKPGTLRALAPHQRVNHFPRSYELTRKDRLYKNIEKMQHLKGYKHFDFIPQTFVMPNEYKELCTTHNKIKGPWIVKPVASSRGRGIFIVETPNQVPLEEPVVVAKYISNPLLVAGHKCDLRLYVVVTSFDPLLVYIYEEGLVRFATVKYDPSHKQLWNPCMHLCNYSINKYHSDYVKSDDPTAENVGHKWTLSALLRHMKAEGKNTGLLMSRIEDLVIKAMLSSANSIIAACRMFVPHPCNCFELYGFDILVDETLKPWLLEVNLSPSLGCDTPLDVRLKSAMLSDLLTLVGIPAIDPILRPSVTALSRPSTRDTSKVKTRFGSCRRVHSADGLSNSLSKKSSSSNSSRISPSLTPEEQRIVRNVNNQFQRRGGFVRIFPAVDSWARYSMYLDSNTGIPLNGNSTHAYPLGTLQQNLNMLVYVQQFPEVPITVNKPNDRSHISRFSSLDRKRERDSFDSRDSISGFHVNPRQNRYERMLSQGHKSALGPKKMSQESRNEELRKQVMDMLRGGKGITQNEARRTFSHYLSCVLKRISTVPEQKDHVEVVLKFLQKASNYLRTPFTVNTPSHKLDCKDRAAIVAKQLNDFLYIYNRETEVFVSNTEKPSSIPTKVYSEFLEHARECDLEEVLMLQTTNSVPNGKVSKGLQGVIKSIPNVPKSQGLRAPYKPNSAKPQTVRVTSLS